MEKRACTLWDRCKTIFPLFCFTALPALVELGIFVWVCQVIYYAVYFENGFFWVCGVAFFIVMMLAFVAVSNFVCMYCRSISPFAQGVDFSGGSRYMKIEYSYGIPSLITGIRPIHVRVSEAGGVGAGFVASMMHAFGIAVVGIPRFLVELVFILVFPKWCIAWKAHTAGVLDEIETEGFVHFFRGFIRCLLILLAIWILFFPFLLGNKAKYSPEHINIQITEKKNWEYNKSRIHVAYYGDLTNTGSAKLKSVGGTIYYKDRNGNVLYQRDEGLWMKSDGMTLPKDYLDKGESFEIQVNVFGDPTDANAQKIWNADMDDIQIVMEITSASYDGGKCIDFKESRTVIIKDFQ